MSRRKKRRKWRDKRNENNENNGNAIIIGNESKEKEEEKLEAVKISDQFEPQDLKIDTVVSKDNDPELSGSVVIEMPRKVFYKMMTYAKLIDKEISGLGYVERINASRFQITDIFLLKQTVSGASCKFDIDDDFRLSQELINAGKNPGQLKMWWHSHVRMSTGWSSTDEDTSYASACDYFISMVVNHDMELRCKVNIYQPVAIEIDDVKVIVMDTLEVSEMIENCKTDIREKVFERETSRIIYPNYPNINQHEFSGFSAHKERDRRNEPAEDKTGVDVHEEEPSFTAPYDEYFQITVDTGVYSFRWNKKTYCYDVYDGSGYILKEHEITEKNLEEYAFPYKFELDEIERTRIMTI